MHHYPFHVGDYIRATAHLDLIEDCIFRRLIDLYMETESPIPNETQQVIRRLRLGSSGLILESILAEFFTLESDNCWHNARCDAEIQAYKRLAEVSRINGKLGGRPKKTQQVILDNPAGTQQEPSRLQPRTKNQEPVCLPPSEVGKTGKPVCPPCPIEEIIETYHETLPTNPRFLVRNETRDGYIRSRWKQFFSEGDFTDKGGGVECFRWFFSEKVKPSKFLTGQSAARNGSPPFIADLEWLMRPTNFAKVVEGKYS